MADDKSENESLDQEPFEQGEGNDVEGAYADSPEEMLDGEILDADDVTGTAEGADSEQVLALKDQLLRAAAEVENIKRRAAKDVENAHKFAVDKLIGELFVVVDSLEKAAETANSTLGAEAIAEGVELSMKLFVDALAKSGVEQIDPLGEPFDPQVHEAMTMVPNPDAEPNSVMDVMQKGYVLNGRLVRAAKVIVVKGPDA